jgi:hypothetical protein
MSPLQGWWMVAVMLFYHNTAPMGLKVNALFMFYHNVALTGLGDGCHDDVLP